MDYETLTHFNIHVLTLDEKGCRHVEEQTLFYMPHCEMWLYSNVLSSNWTSVSNVVIMGNSFAEYQLK